MNLDRYFQALYNRTETVQDLVNAGWLDKITDVPLKERFHVTPVEAIRKTGLKEVSVLFYPGCFAPVHEGHLRAMRLAKEAVETTGETVAAGYFTPDHDDYIMRKTNDQRFIAPNRLAYLNEATKLEPWMQVDPWASMYAPTDLNFTTLYDRLDRYMKRWLPDVNVKIYMVFGGDNYLFANAFTEYGHGVCVPRAGSNIDKNLIHPDAQKRVIFSETISANDSSTAARAAMQEPADFMSRTSTGTKYVLRDDLALAFPHNPTDYSHKVLSDSVYILLTAHLPYETVKVERVNVAEQLKAHADNQQTISLDCFWEGEHNLNVSRLFTPAGGQHHAESYTNRPNTPTLEEQFTAVTPGEYTLVDDDIATGETMNTITSMLETHGVIITEQKSLIQSLQENLYDVVDLRDFIIGAKHGGLLVTAPNGQHTRMPYIMPYVNLTTRARINPDRIYSLSVEFWKLNHTIYKNTAVTLADIKQHQDFTAFGFDGEMAVAELCNKHLTMLLNQPTL